MGGMLGKVAAGVLVLGVSFVACSSGSGGGGGALPDAGSDAFGGTGGTDGGLGGTQADASPDVGATGGVGGNPDDAGDATADADASPGTGSSCDDVIDITSTFEAGGVYQGIAVGAAANIGCGAGASSVLVVDLDHPGNYRLDVSGVTGGPHAPLKPDASVSIRGECADVSSELRCEPQVAYKNVAFGVPEAGPLYIVLAGDYFLDGYSVHLQDLGTCSFSGCSSFFPQSECDGSGACVAPLFCNPGFENCDNLVANGCEANLESTASCGACNVKCPTAGVASSSCNSGTCSFSCQSGRSDCDLVVSNGCECGPNSAQNIAAASCVSNVCVPTCSSGTQNCGGTCVDTSVSNTHCGACNAACTGLCNAGKCIPKGEALGKVSNPYSAGPVAIDATHAFFVNAPGNAQAKILSVPLAGGTPSTVIALADIEDIAVDANDIYFTRSTTTGEVHRVPKTGGTSTLLGTMTGSASTIALDSTHVYALSSYQVARFPKAGGTKENLYSSGDIQSLAVDGAYAYITTNLFALGGAKLSRLPKTGGTPFALSPSLNNPGPVALDATYGFVATLEGVTRVTLATGAASAVAIFSKPGGVERVAPFGSYLYFVVDTDTVIGGTTFGGFVGRVPILGGNVDYLATIPDNPISGGIVGGLAVDANYVYFTQDQCCVDPEGLLRAPHD